MMLLTLTLLFAQADGFSAAITAGREKCQQGQRLSIELKAKEAESMYEEGIESYMRGLPALENVREYARCLIDYGASMFANEQKKAAEALFLRALILETGEEIDAGVHNPRVVAAFSAVKKRTAKAKRTQLSVHGTPANASVIVDGRDAGKLPWAELAVLPGEHLVRVIADGHSAFFSRVRVAEAKTDDLAVALTPVETDAPAPIVLQVTPGEQPATAPVAIVPVPARQTYKVHPVVALLPLGIGQFAERRYGVGAVFLSTQLLLLGGNLASYWAMKSVQGPDGYFSARDVGLGTGLFIATNVALGLLLVDVIIGTIDGLLHREVTF